MFGAQGLLVTGALLAIQSVETAGKTNASSGCHLTFRGLNLEEPYGEVSP